MKKLLKGFGKLSTGQKVEFVLALLITLMLTIGIPVFAWFIYSNRLETMTKIKEPDNLDIRAGNFDQIINFELRNIDIEDIKENQTSQCYVFSVSAGDYKIPYILQLAYTRNIPFKYSLWKAEQVESGRVGIVQYHPLSDPDDITYYEKKTELELVPQNTDSESKAYFGRELALSEGTYYDKTYVEGDTPEIYAIPIYMQTAAITPDNNESNQHDYFILELSWDEEAAAATGFTKWNKAENNKETDIIYISASRTTG